jgi:putative membrane protein
MNHELDHGSRRGEHCHDDQQRRAPPAADAPAGARRRGAAPDNRRRRPGSRSLATLALVAGLALAIWLIVRVGAPAIGAGLQTAGWTGLWAISGFHLIATALMGLAWWRLRRVGARLTFIWGRLVRDAGSEILPLSQIGGCLLGARAVTTQGVAAATAGATMLIDATLEFGAQIAYIALGLALLIWQLPDTPLVGPVLAAAVVLGASGALVAIVQRRGVPRRLALSPRLAWLKAACAERLAEFKGELANINRGKRTLWPSFLLHLAAWLLSGVEAWLALRFMGAHFSLIAVLALEAQVYAMRSFAFLIPSAIGVQEGAYVVASAALGLPADLALGLSLLKRARDVTLAIPALLSWQLVETRRGWRRQVAAPAKPGAD